MGDRTQSAGYAYDNTWSRARERLRGLEDRFDAGTIRHLEALGVDEGWSCLEIGAGGGTIADWLCQKVGQSGRVLATDIDPRFVEMLGHPNLTTRRHHIAHDPLAERAFDLVHARMVLSHVPQRDQALRKMAAALKPGGWLLCEEGDNISVCLVSPSDDESVAVYRTVESAIATVMASRGHAYDYGRGLLAAFRGLGLADTAAEGRLLPRTAGASADVARLTVEQLRDEVIASRLATEAQVETYLALLHDSTFVALPLTLIATWGRRTTV
ncbi:MAG: methyltransferase domain-containing protein [Candidatus Limnocylindrales bacterium]